MKTKNFKHFPADTSLDYSTFLNDSKIDAELYNYFLSLSYGDEKIKQTIVYKENLPSQETIGTILHISRRTVINHLKYLKEKGYIAESDDKKYYILPKVEKMYFKIPQDTICFLRDTVKDPVIKAYIYLGQRNSYKPGEYTFTLKEICQHLGLNYERNYQTIKHYLEILGKCNLIEYAEIYENKVPKMKLLNVSTECPKYNCAKL